MGMEHNLHFEKCIEALGGLLLTLPLLLRDLLNQGLRIWGALEPGAEGKACVWVTFAYPRIGPRRAQAPRGHSSHGTS